MNEIKETSGVVVVDEINKIFIKFSGVMRTLNASIPVFSEIRIDKGDELGNSYLFIDFYSSNNTVAHVILKYFINELNENKITS